MSDDANPLEILARWYPAALSTTDAVERLFDLMGKRLGLPPGRILAADSICCDDIDAIQYPERASEMLGPFRMGGLDGFPFAGLTGMGAFAHHVPEDGALFLFFGPHIGFTMRGEVGRVLRFGQREASACCGAACAALAKLSEDAIREGERTELDYQQNTLEQILLAERARILGAKEPIVEATEVVYEASERRIRELVERTSFPCSRIVLMGAILINGDRDVGSFCECRRLVSLDTSTGAEDDWTSHFQERAGA